MINKDEIKKRRKELGYSQLKVAVLCDVTMQAYINWEHGANKPCPRNEGKLREVLGL